MFRSTWYVATSSPCRRRRTASAAAPSSSAVASSRSVTASAGARRAPSSTASRMRATRREPPRPGTGGAASGRALISRSALRYERHAGERREVRGRDEAVRGRAAEELRQALLVLLLEVVV